MENLKIIESALQQALGLGLFKSFNDAATVQNALIEIKDELDILEKLRREHEIKELQKDVAL